MFNLDFFFSSILIDWYHFACSAQLKLCFLANYHGCIALPTWHRCAPPILFWPWPSYNLLLRSYLTWIFFVNPHWSYAFSTNYHAWIALPTWRRCAPPILFWPWPPYNLLPKSCLTWIVFVDSHWWVQLCVQKQAKAMLFQQNTMHAL